MLRILIVDDEPKARSLISTFVDEFDLDTEIVAKVSNIPEAVKAINTQNPDLVLLDIEMPQQNGFALFDYFDDLNFQVIFITASQNYAIDAFRVSALDYILKPINKSHLKSALLKAASSHQFVSQVQVDVFKQAMKSQSPKRIALSSNEKIEFISINDISYMKADGPYTEFHLVSDETIVVSKNIGDYEMIEKLPHFFRIHRSFLVNLQEVKSFHKEEGGQVVMKNGAILHISRYRKSEFLEIMMNRKLD